MTKEYPHPERVTYYTHHLDHLRKKIVAATRNSYLDKPLGERQAAITQLMKEIIPVPEFVDQFLEKQIGSAAWDLTPEDLEDLPPRAIERSRESFENRSKVLWPWLLFDKNHEQLRMDFMKNYLMAAQMTGTFPFKPTFEAVAMQRDIAWKHRLLAAQLMFAENCVISPEINIAATPLLGMIGNALEIYSGQDVSSLQAMVRRKAPKLNNNDINQFIQYRTQGRGQNILF